jgi:hypothetical protein
MKLIVWNSQGAKWDIAYTNWVSTSIGTDVALCLVEAGHAPWVDPKVDLTIGRAYAFDTGATWFSQSGAAQSSFCDGVAQERLNKTIWIPWMKNIDPKVTNFRCSLGMGWFPEKMQLHDPDSWSNGFLRPTVRFGMGSAKDVQLTVIVVHMISGFPSQAAQQLQDLVSLMTKIIPEGTPAVIVGDMNVDLLKVGDYSLPDKWRTLKTGVATQMSGGELDYAFFFDPNENLDASVTCLEKYKTGSNTSDHSVLQYTLDL